MDLGISGFELVCSQQFLFAIFQVASIPTPNPGIIQGVIPTQFANNPGVYVLEFVITDDTLYPRARSNGEVVLTSAPVGTTSYVITTTAGTYTFTTLPVAPVVGIGQSLIQGQQLVKNVVVVLSNTLYLYVERGIHGTADVGTGFGPPCLAEVRLHLRDAPESNLLLDEFEFDEAEIAMAVTRPVEYWNETPPPLISQYDTTTFPFRYYWLEGICWQLFLIAANWFRRNRLPYSAGGLTIDDTGKEKEYLAAAEMYGQRYREWCLQKKVQLNMMDGFATFPSDYSPYWHW